MRRITIVATTVATAVVLPASAAMALQCSNANKPAGAGTFDPADMRFAGQSGQAVLSGGFVFVPELGEEVFVHGPADQEFADFLQGSLGIDIVGNGFGSLPHQAAPHYHHHD